MKILRAVNRRGFNVGSAGYFSLLRPNTWFAASRLRDESSYLVGRYKTTAHPDTQNPATPSLDAKLNASDPNWKRVALTILAGIAITCALLWSLMSEAPPNNYP
jgi:hypothetical protein